LFLLVLTACNLTASPVALASPARQDCSGAAITSPRESGDPVRGHVNISGSASIPNFQFYKVEFAAGSNPADTSFRNMASDVHRSPVQAGLLDVWDTTGLPDGPFTLRLTVVDIRGNFPCPPVLVRPVIVANSAPLATSTPTITPTEVITPTLAPSSATTRPVAPTIAVPTSAARATDSLSATGSTTNTNPSRQFFNFDFLPLMGQGLTWGICGMGLLLIVVSVYTVARYVFDRL